MPLLTGLDIARQRGRGGTGRHRGREGTDVGLLGRGNGRTGRRLNLGRLLLGAARRQGAHTGDGDRSSRERNRASNTSHGFHPRYQVRQSR